MLQIKSEHRLRQENLAFDIDTYYPLVSDLTPRSRFVPLSREEAAAVVAHYRNWQRLKRCDEFSNDHLRVLFQLERRIEAALPPGEVCFARLCGRSPKDAVVRGTRDEFDALALASSPYSALCEMQRRTMRCEGPRDVMALLLSSERVFADLMDFIQYGEPEQIVLREWREEIQLQFEFRCFVTHNRLVKISQYDHYGFFPDLLPLKERIEAAIRRAWLVVHPRLRCAHYVVDFYYSPKGDFVEMIELSPFRAGTTGGGLFGWNEITPDCEFEFRLASEARPLAELVEAWAHTAFEMSYAPLPYLEQGWRERSAATVTGWLSQLTATEEKRILFFFYGTLKRQMHWNSKYLHRATFVSEAESEEAMWLLVGGCGVPYLMMQGAENAKRVRGELWLVDDETIAGLDEHEGVGKGYYARRHIGCIRNDGTRETAQVYFLLPDTDVSRRLREGQIEAVAEYTLDMHKRLYSPIELLSLKQAIYLGESAHTAT